jgi:hypothetical protein
MPSRHISSQSFDDILSDLGDDPAIPDPHGVRKNPAASQTQFRAPSTPKRGLLPGISIPIGVNRNWFFLVLAGGVVSLSLCLFWVIESQKVDSQASLVEMNQQIVSLKKELTSAIEGWENDQEELYSILDEIEVSIHSKLISATSQKVIRAPAAYPDETELLRWRYLGITRIGMIEQAFFQTGKKTMMVKKEGLVLGEWRLSQAQKEAAILTHPKGKSITLKSSQSE